MAKSQRRPLNPPTPEDRDLLLDYTSSVQYSLTDLFLAAHDHLVLTKSPAANDGTVQQISVVDDGTNVYLVVKTNRGWFKSANFSAV